MLILTMANEEERCAFQFRESSNKGEYEMPVEIVQSLRGFIENHQSWLLYQPAGDQYQPLLSPG